MSYRKKIKYIFILILVTYSTLSFSENYDISNIVLAKSAGIWSEEKNYGYFKVIVYRVGLEHPIDKVKILITQVNTRLNNQAIIKEIELESPGIKGYVNDLSLAIVNNQLSLGMDIEMKAMDNIVLRESFLITRNGSVKVIMPARYTDIYD